MIWGVTGTPHHVDYFQNLKIIGKMLRFEPRIFDEDNINNFRRFFIENCIRKNGNLKNLPPVKKQLVYSQMQILENVLYKAKLKHNLS